MNVNNQSSPSVRELLVQMGAQGPQFTVLYNKQQTINDLCLKIIRSLTSHGLQPQQAGNFVGDVAFSYDGRLYAVQLGNREKFKELIESDNLEKVRCLLWADETQQLIKKQFMTPSLFSCCYFPATEHANYLIPKRNIF